MAGPPPDLDDGDDCTVDSCDPVVGVQHAACAPLDPAFTTTVGDALSFLISGTDPVQRDVAPGAIDTVRAAGVTGRVVGPDGQPWMGATVRVVGDSSLGWTTTDAQGDFTMLVEGGGQQTLQVTSPGHVPAQRSVTLPWQGWLHTSDVMLVALSAAATTDLTALATLATVEGEPAVDAAGVRTPVLLVPPGSAATMTFADGTTAPLPVMTVRMTELTVGPDGPRRMPAALPDSSAYTHAFEVTVDQAEAAGATGVVLATPLPFYLENYIGFPVGEAVPVGRYDRQRGTWVPEDNGVVVEVVGNGAGLAELDLTGDGLAATAAKLAAAGISDEERGRVAELYDLGATLWRIPLSHFSAVDANWPFTPEDFLRTHGVRR